MADIQINGRNKNYERGYRGYTRYCGEMKQWTDNVEHVAFLGKKKMQVFQAQKKVIISIITRYNTFLTSARYIITQNMISLDT